MKRFKSCYDRQKKMKIELNWIELKIDIKRLQNRPAFSKGHSKKARLHGLMMCIEVQVYVYDWCRSIRERRQKVYVYWGVVSGKGSGKEDNNKTHKNKLTQGSTKF